MEINNKEPDLISSVDYSRQLAMAKLAKDTNAFLDKAEKALVAGPFTVTEKTAPAPGGTLHDYWSMGIYWWPNPEKTKGLPYIRRDGYVNPRSHDLNFDRVRMDGLTGAVETLLEAWFATDDKKYSARITHLIRVFFLDEATRMNPSLTYGQSIPGICEGRGIGIIETVKLINLIDAVVHLRQAGLYPDEDWVGLRTWFSAYLDWLQTSQHGIDERAAKNNHGSWMDAQLIAFAIFTDQLNIAREIAQEVPARRINTQIMPDGSQPLEIERTRSFSYSTYNLTAFVIIAQLASRLGIDLWNYCGPDKQSIPAAFEFLTPFATGEREWIYLQIDDKTGEKCTRLDEKTRRIFSTLRERIADPLRTRGACLPYSC